MCFVLTLNSCIYNAQAAEDTVMEKDFIYVDGIKYDYVIDKDGTIKIETDSSKVNGKLILNSEANGVVQVENTDGKRALINRAFLTLIGLGPDNRPAILPRLILKSEEDRKEWERAEIRRSLRRKQREEGFHFYGE